MTAPAKRMWRVRYLDNAGRRCQRFVEGAIDADEAGHAACSRGDVASFESINEVDPETGKALVADANLWADAEADRIRGVLGVDSSEPEGLVEFKALLAAEVADWEARGLITAIVAEPGDTAAARELLADIDAQTGIVSSEDRIASLALKIATLRETDGAVSTGAAERRVFDSHVVGERISLEEACGVASLVFICPTCGGTYFITGASEPWVDAFGYCKGGSLRCSFKWKRTDDWMVFRVVRPAESREEYERIRARLAGPPVQVPT